MREDNISTLLGKNTISDDQFASNQIRTNSSYLQCNEKSQSQYDSISQRNCSSASQISTGSRENILKVDLLKGKSHIIEHSYLIDTKGLIAEGRQAEDGFVFFGSQENQNGTRINDVIVQDCSIGKCQFYIKYDQNLQKFFLKDLERGTGTFTQIQKPTKLSTGQIISFGTTHMAVSISQDSNRISFHFLEGSKAQLSCHFEKEQNISFGRLENCTVKFEDTNMSRIQCLVCYNNGWYVVDGNGERISTNGTWLFQLSPIEVHDGMRISAGTYKFHIKVVELEY